MVGERGGSKGRKARDPGRAEGQGTERKKQGRSRVKGTRHRSARGTGRWGEVGDGGARREVESKSQEGKREGNRRAIQRSGQHLGEVRGRAS